MKDGVLGCLGWSSEDEFEKGARMEGKKGGTTRDGIKEGRKTE